MNRFLQRIWTARPTPSLWASRPLRAPVHVMAWVMLLCTSIAWGASPLYKPSARSPAPLDITTNEYGYSTNAPQALAIGDKAPDFVVPGQSKQLSLAALRRNGPVVIIFYRGHW